MARDIKSIVGGLVLVGIAAFFFFAAQGYSFGTLARVGSGFYPFVLALVLGALGIAIAVQGWRQEGEAPKIDLRPLLIVPGGIVVFALVLRHIGLFPSVMLLVAISRLADDVFRPLPVLALATVLAAGATVLFVVVLGVNVPIVRWPF